MPCEVAVALAVAVGGAWVAVGGMGVAVGFAGGVLVAEGGKAVFEGNGVFDGKGVDVAVDVAGGSGVFVAVAGIAVGVEDGAAAPPNKVMTTLSTKRSVRALALAAVKRSWKADVR